jgi:hypothetical protein
MMMQGWLSSQMTQSQYIGGLIMFFVTKDEDRNMAKKGLILGIILTAVGFVLSFVVLLFFAAIGSQLEQQLPTMISG